jgi:hypothetical protein
MLLLQKLSICLHVPHRYTRSNIVAVHYQSTVSGASAGSLQTPWLTKSAPLGRCPDPNEGEMEKFRLTAPASTSTQL